MGTITALIKKFASFFPFIPNIKGDLPDWLNSPLVPVFHCLFVVVLLIFTLRHFLQVRKQQQLTKCQPINQVSDSYETTLNNLTWVNKLISWAYQTSSSKAPHFVETWIQDINISLANQKNKFSTLVSGLREGSAPPWLIHIRKLKHVDSEICAEVLLKTEEFGFFVTIQEPSSKLITSSNYSAVVAQFQCWYSASLLHKNGTLSLLLTPIDNRPLLRFEMKQITKQAVVSTIPEAVADALRSAVMRTPFQAHLHVSGELVPQVEGSSEESCYGSSDEDVEFKDTKDSTSSLRASRSMSLGQVLERPTVVKRRLTNEGLLTVGGSEPPSRCVSPVVNGYAPQNLSESTGSLSNLTRSASGRGRGPAKPIRFREKRLLTKVAAVEGLPAKGTRVCSFELDFPGQIKTINLLKNGFAGDDLMTFDLSSRSSKLKMVVHDLKSASTNQDVVLGEAIVFIDSISTDNRTNLPVAVKDGAGNDVGTLQLEFSVKENSGSKLQMDATKRNGLDTHRRVPTSLPTETKYSASSELASPQRSPSSSADKSETKVTMVTRVKGSPSKTVLPEPALLEGAEDPGVRFDDGSVAEIALKHLSARPSQKVVTKSKISITTVEQNKGNSSSPDLRHLPTIVTSSPPSNGASFDDVISEDQQDIAASLPSVRTAQSEIDTLKAEAMTPTGRLKQDGAGVRRTRSLMFKSKKKSKHRSNSLTGEENGEPTSTELVSIPQNSLRAKKKSPSMTKLFTRMKRGKKEKAASGNNNLSDSLSESPLVGDREDTSSEVSSTKIKRNRSFKNILKGKKKTSTS